MSRQAFGHGGRGCRSGPPGRSTRRYGRCSHYAVRVKLAGRERRASWCRTRSRSGARFSTFETRRRTRAIAEELAPRSGRSRSFVGLTGLRPEEWLALEWRDIDRRRRRRPRSPRLSRTGAEVYGKQGRSLGPSRCPLQGRCRRSKALPPRLDSPRLFPGERGGFLNLNEWRARRLDAGAQSGRARPSRPVRAQAHATRRSRSRQASRCSSWRGSWARSVDQIDSTYGHLLPRLDRPHADGARRVRRGGAGRRGALRRLGTRARTLLRRTRKAP